MAVGGPVEAMSNGNNIAAYMGQDKFAEGGEIGGYVFDPKTGLYTRPGGQGATVVSPTGGISGASEGNFSDYVNPNVAKESFEKQSVRSQKLNDILTDASVLLSPGSAIARAFLDTPIAGGIANFFSPPGPVNYSIPVEDAVSNQNYGFPGNDSMNLGGGNPTGDRDFGGGSTDAAGRDSEGTPLARGGLTALAQGGISNLGDYSDGGRLLRGPGDGVSDDIPAMIGQKQQARLADGEFVVPARIVSELGNGSTEAGARQLYAMMDRVQKARKKTVGKDKVATNSRAAKLLPA